MPNSFCDLIGCVVSRLPFLSPGDLPDPGIEPTSPASAGRFFTSESPGQADIYIYTYTHIHICMCVYTHTPRFSIYLSGDAYLGFFPVLSVVNNATVKMRVQLPFLFIYYFWLHWVFSAVCRLSLVGARELGLLFIAVHGLLVATASLVEHRL